MTIEYLINKLEEFNADELKETFEVEKDDKKYIFDVTLKRKD